MYLGLILILLPRVGVRGVVNNTFDFHIVELINELSDKGLEGDGERSD